MTDRSDSHQLSEILDDLSKDSNIPFFYDRQYPQSLTSKVYYWSQRELNPWGLVNYWSLCLDWARDEYLAVQKQRPAFRYAASMPHQAEWYVRSRVNELCGIPFYLFHDSRIFGYSYLCLGMSKKPIKLRINSEQSRKYLLASEQYIEKCDAKYADAMPEYERVRLRRQRGRYFSTLRLIKDFWHRPSWLANTHRCWSTLKAQAITAAEITSQRYAVFFLHYQPERTTLPESFGFVQQKRAVTALRESLPEDCLLLVKEHPSTFTNQCDPRFRSPEFYRSLGAIPGVKWVDIAIDNFELIDAAVLTASICGTVNTESLIRGIPTILFGIQKFAGCEGQHYFSDHDSLKEFVSKACHGAWSQSAIRESIRNAIVADSDLVIEREAIDTPAKRLAFVTGIHNAQSGA